MTTIHFGQGDSTLQAVGGSQGLRQLVEDFYLIMGTHTEFKPLFTMHPDNLGLSIDKLYCFLHGWMGGERLYSQKYGAISLPQAHAHLTIGEADKQQWLDCMRLAMNKQGYSDELKEYLITQLAVPAERIRQVSAAHQAINSQS